MEYRLNRREFLKSLAAVTLLGASAGCSRLPRISTTPPGTSFDLTLPPSTSAGITTTTVEAATTSPPSAVILDRPMVGGCRIYPGDNPWNTDVSEYPPDPHSAEIIERLRPTWKLVVYPQKPYNVVDASQDKVPVHYTAYGRTSDPGPMPIPRNALFMQREAGTSPLTQAKNLTDNHLMVLDTEGCKLYELWSVTGANPDGSWDAASGAIYDLSSDALRPAKWASATASGLPVFAGLVRADEVKAGKILHALNMMTTYTRPGYIHPATSYQGQFGSGTDWDNPYNPVMGMRLRLKKSYSIYFMSPQAKIIASALQTYGAFISDGSSSAGNMYANPDPFWDINDIDSLHAIPPDAFEVVQTGEVLY